ncbi:hypothetical protein WA588_003924 [Blastocystis sp. NMH]
MQDIRNILSLAAEKAESGDLQAAISYYETSFSESQKAQCVGGMFCASKRLGDIYYLLGYTEHSMNWYKFASALVDLEYTKEPLIRESLHFVLQRILNMAKREEQWKDEIPVVEERLRAMETASSRLEEKSYDTVVRKMESDSKLYDSFFNNCKKNSMRMVLRCIHKGIDVNHINPQTKYTALHNACWRGHKDIVCVLLRHGADMTIPNGEGEDCIRCAEMANQSEIVELLKKVQKEGVAL